MLIYLLVTNKIKSGEGIRWFTRKRIGDVALHAGASPAQAWAGGAKATVRATLFLFINILAVDKQ